MPIVLNVNGEDRVSSRGPLTPLIDVLRDELFLTGAKEVCREGICGACTVMMDSKPVMSCLVPTGVAERHAIRTAESLSSDGEPSPLQQIMLYHDVVQCGMCFPGMMVTLTDFLDHTPEPSREEIKVALVGNICRCTGGQLERLVRGVALAVNSVHVQAVDRLGEGLVVEALASDGTIEALSFGGNHFALGVQWHPEFMAATNPLSARLFTAFGDAVRRYASGGSTHSITGDQPPGTLPRIGSVFASSKELLSRGKKEIVELTHDPENQSRFFR